MRQETRPLLIRRLSVHIADTEMFRRDLLDGTDDLRLLNGNMVLRVEPQASSRDLDGCAVAEILPFLKLHAMAPGLAVTTMPSSHGKKVIDAIISMFEPDASPATISFRQRLNYVTVQMFKKRQYELVVKLKITDPHDENWTTMETTVRDTREGFLALLSAEHRDSVEENHNIWIGLSWPKVSEMNDYRWIVVLAPRNGV
jgi:hypothetical protein